MRKIFLSVLTVAVFSACSRPNPDFIALENALMTPGVEVVGFGSVNDTVFIKIPATSEIMSIAGKTKNTVFWSNLESGNIIDHVGDDTCLVDAKTDYIGDCPYRLYCGGAIELMIAMAVNSVYATEICK